MLKQYLYNLALALDQFINTILLGDPDDSISGRCGRALLSKRPKWFVTPLSKFVDFLFLLLFKVQNHIKNSVESEELLEKELWSWIKKPN